MIKIVIVRALSDMYGRRKYHLYRDWLVVSPSPDVIRCRHRRVICRDCHRTTVWSSSSRVTLSPRDLSWLPSYHCVWSSSSCVTYSPRDLSSVPLYHCVWSSSSRVTLSPRDLSWLPSYHVCGRLHRVWHSRRVICRLCHCTTVSGSIHTVSSSLRDLSWRHL